MRTINFTIDNLFRNPLRWGSCPIDIEKVWCFGFKYQSVPAIGRLGLSWEFTVYYGFRFWKIGKH